MADFAPATDVDILPGIELSEWEMRRKTCLKRKDARPAEHTNSRFRDAPKYRYPRQLIGFRKRD